MQPGSVNLEADETREQFADVNVFDFQIWKTVFFLELPDSEFTLYQRVGRVFQFFTTCALERVLQDGDIVGNAVEGDDFVSIQQVEYGGFI